MPSPAIAAAQYDNPALWSAQDPKDWVTGLACGKGLPVLEEGEITQIKIAGAANAIEDDAPALEVGRLAQTAMEDQPSGVESIKPTKQSDVCFDFAQRAVCRKGYTCKRVHLTKPELLKMGLEAPKLHYETSYFESLSPQVSHTIKRELRKSKICQSFLHGKCFRRDGCFFAHIGGPDAVKILTERNALKDCPFLKHADLCHSHECTFKHAPKAVVFAKKAEQRKQLTQKRKLAKNKVKDNREVSVDLLDLHSVEEGCGDSSPSSTSEMDIFEMAPLPNSDGSESSTEEVSSGAEILDDAYLAELLGDK